MQINFTLQTLNNIYKRCNRFATDKLLALEYGQIIIPDHGDEAETNSTHPTVRMQKLSTHVSWSGGCESPVQLRQL